MSSTTLRFAKRFLALTALALLAFPLVACGEDEAPPPMAAVRFVHAAPTLGRIDIKIDDNKISLAGAALSPVVQVEPGNSTITVTNTGAQQSLITTEENLSAGHHVFAIAGTQSDDTLQLVRIGDLRPELDSDISGFFVFNAMSRDMNFDLYVNGSSNAEELTRFAQTGYFLSKPADATVRVYTAGVDPNNTVPLLNLKDTDLKLRSRGLFAIILTGDSDGVQARSVRIN